MSLDICVYSYISQQIAYIDPTLKINDIFRQVVEPFEKDNTDEEDNTEESPASFVQKPLPLKDDKLAPVAWYYSLFTEDELKTALAKHNSSFPTKCFLVFEGLDPITLGASGKELVKFITVSKDDVDKAIKNALGST